MLFCWQTCVLSCLSLRVGRGTKLVMWTGADVARGGPSGTEGEPLLCRLWLAVPGSLSIFWAFPNSCDRNDCNCNQVLLF